MNTWLMRARRRLRFANVTSAVALFVALGGTSYAAITLPRNSVGTAQLRTHAVQRSDVAKNAVGRWQILHDGVYRSEIRRDAVGPSELRGNAVSSDEVADGTLEAADLSSAARSALNGVSFRVASTAAGAVASAKCTRRSARPSLRGGCD